MLQLIAKLLKVLNSEAEPGQISLAFCFSMVVGFTPLYSIHNILIILAVLILRVNLSAFILGWAFFSGLSFAFDPLFHSIGKAALTSASLEGLWTSFYNSTLFRLEHFNNTILMGSLLLSLLFFIPLYFASNIIIVKYRENILAWIQKTKVMQMFKASRIFNYYQSARGWGG